MTVPEIVCKIVAAKKAYYQDGKPVMNDYEYDMLEAALKKEDPRHPLLNMVGYDEAYQWWVDHYNYVAHLERSVPQEKPNIYRDLGL